MSTSKIQTPAQAERIPRAGRDRPGSAFGAVLPDGGDGWQRALALLGRAPRGKLAA